MVSLTDAAVAEVAVIGSMLIDDKCIGRIVAELQPDDFLVDSYREIFLTIRKMFGAGETIDPVTVLGALKGKGGQDWYGIIHQSMEVTPSSANVMEYVPIVRRQSRLAKIQTLGNQLQEARSLDEAGEYISKLNAHLAERPGVKITTMEQGLADFFERHRTREVYLPWGFRDLDKRIYVKRGKFVILGGYPSAGKTAMALSMAWTMAEKYRVGFFSLETDDGTLIDRLVANVMLISMAKIKKSDLTDEDYSVVAELSSRITDRNLEIISASGMTVDDIFAHAQSRRYDVIFVDYIQLIRGIKSRGRTEEITGISIDLHTKAQTTGINIVGLSQLSRPEKSSKGRRTAPTMSDLRESGQLEQDADVIMLLYLEDPDDPDSLRILKVAKNKEGEVGQLHLVFDGSTQFFRKWGEPKPEPPSKKEPEYEQVTLEELPADATVPF